MICSRSTDAVLYSLVRSALCKLQLGDAKARLLESCNAQVGSSIHLVVSEQGLDGLAEVLE